MKLAGNPELDMTFTIPTSQSEYSAFVLLAGSGKVDRDGNFKKMSFNMYKILSDFLNEQGFASLRYDKRGTGESGGDFYTTGLKDLLYDVDRAVKYVRQQPHVQNVYLLGHSEGCILATIYAKDHSVDGLVLLSGAGISLKTAMQTQNNAIVEELGALPGIKGAMLRMLIKKEKIKKNQQNIFRKVGSTDKDVIRIQMIKYNAKWMREHFAYTDQDINNILGSITIPALAITGDKDVQADVQALDNVQALENERITVKCIRNMDHMLRIHEGEKTILNLKKQYKDDLKKPLAADLLTEIKAFTRGLKT